jgi:hypothetical protein
MGARGLAFVQMARFILGNFSGNVVRFNARRERISACLPLGFPVANGITFGPDEGKL